MSEKVEASSPAEAAVVEPAGGPVFEPYESPQVAGVRCRPRRAHCASLARPAAHQLTIRAGVSRLGLNQPAV